MKNFFTNFLKEYRFKIIFFSFFRIISFIQTLLWPYAFSQVVNILTSEPNLWSKALFWIIAMVFNKVLEDFIRLRSKFGLEKLATRLKVDLAEYFSEQTEVCDERHTGEAVQAIRQASDVVEGLVNFYKENALQLPVNLIAIPLILYQADKSYLSLLLAYVAFYIVFDYILARAYQIQIAKYFVAMEMFWGKAYRKVPEVWRHRENADIFSNDSSGEGVQLYDKTVGAKDISNWRWIVVQSFSSASLGMAVLFVLFRVANGVAQVGDLVLVSSYFQKTQGTLNMLTNAITHYIHTKIALKRLNKAVRLR